MKTKPSTPANNSFPHDARIDAVLGAYSHAVPAPGLESRVAARISATSRPVMRSQGASRLVLLRWLSAAALAVAAAVAIVVGIVQHSHNINLQQRATGISRPGGVSAADSKHTPAQPIPQTPTIDPQAPRTPPHGRANSSGNQERRTTGTAVPRTPYPLQQPAAAPQQ